MAEIKWTDTKPEFAEYQDWLATVHDITNLDVMKNHYLAVADRVKRAVETSEFWTDLSQNISNIADQYKMEKREKLLVPTMPPLDVKSWDSFLNKTYRKNILNNSRYPDAPIGGWLFPPDWAANINDLIRTMFVVRYLDGVDFLSKRVCDTLKTHGCFQRRDYEAKIEGYYAIHIYASIDVDVPDLLLNTVSRNFAFEIQITTEVKEFVKSLLHKIYDVARISQEKPEKTWAWDYESDEFIAHNLGHMVHYVEGMLVQVRDRQRDRK